MCTQRARNSKGVGSTSAAIIFKGREKFKGYDDDTLCVFLKRPCCDDVSSLSLSLSPPFIFLSFKKLNILRLPPPPFLLSGHVVIVSIYRI